MTPHKICPLFRVCCGGGSGGGGSGLFTFQCQILNSMSDTCASKLKDAIYEC